MYVIKKTKGFTLNCKEFIRWGVCLDSLEIWVVSYFGDLRKVKIYDYVQGDRENLSCGQRRKMVCNDVAATVHIHL